MRRREPADELRAVGLLEEQVLVEADAAVAVPVLRVVDLIAEVVHHWVGERHQALVDRPLGGFLQGIRRDGYVADAPVELPLPGRALILPATAVSLP